MAVFLFFNNLEEAQRSNHGVGAGLFKGAGARANALRVVIAFEQNNVQNK
jgi:hypothetical protein